MFGITEKYNKLKENPSFIGFKDGANFGAYFFGIYLAATLTVGCLGLITGYTFLMMPLAVLISNPIAWIVIGIVLAVAYKIAIKPLIHLTKDFINKKRTPKKEKGEEKAVELQKQNAEEHKLTRSTSVDSVLVPGNNSKEIEKLKRSRSLDSGNDSGIGTSAESSGTLTPDKESSCKSSFSTLSAASSESGVSEISSPVDVAAYDENYRSQNLINQTQAGNYNYLLQQADIGNLARIVHDLDPEVYEIIGSNDQLKKQLNRFKSKVKKNSETQKLTFIINLQNGHWVTLCVSHYDEQFSAYYYDSLNGKQYRSTFSKILQEELNIGEDNIRFFEGKTQSDGSNCGIFALEAASRINQMLNKGKSLNDVDEVLLEYKPTASELKKLREQLAEILNNDEVNSEFVVTAPTPINNASHCSIL